MPKTKERLTRGTLLKRHGAWHVRYYEGGKQRSTKVCDVSDEFRTKGDVIPEANKLLARIVPAVEKTRSGNKKITEFADNIFLPWVKTERRPATYDGYRKLYNAHLKDHFGDRLLFDYEPHHATDFLTKLARKGMGRYAVSHVRALMSGIFAHAVALGYLRVNPIHDAKLLTSPKAPPPTPHYTLDEMKDVLNALRADPFSSALMALSFIGLRPAEARGLKWEDVDIKNGVLHVRRSAWRKHLSEGGKGRRSARTVSFGPVVASILEAHRSSLPLPTTYVLENGKGNPIDLWNYTRKFIQPRLSDAGIMWKSLYAGRRGSETEMARHVNGNTQLTAPQFGHSHRVAEEFYLKPIPDETRKAALALDAGLQGTTSDSTEKSSQQEIATTAVNKPL